MQNRAEKHRAEQRLRDALVQTYQEAQTGPQFLEALVKLHGALEQTFDIVLDSDTDDLHSISFGEKAYRVARNATQNHSISNANYQRNQLIHNLRDFTDAETKELADRFARFAIDAWPTLFGSSSRAPTVRPPSLVERQRASRPAAKRPSETEPTSVRSRRPIAWRALFLALTLFVIVIWWAGFTSHLWRDDEAPTYIASAAFGIMLIFCIYCLRNLRRFLRSARFIRGSVVFSFSLVALSLLALPFSTNTSSQQPSGAFGFLRSSVARATTLVSSGGASFAENHVVPELGKVLPGNAGMAEATSAPRLQESTNTPAPTPPVNNRSDERLAVGQKATVVTGGGRLRIRQEPALTAAILAHLENGSTVDIVDGPVEDEEFTWWEVEGYGVRGWCAGDFLQVKQDS